VVRPALCKKVAGYLQECYRVSTRKAAQNACIARATMYYKKKSDPQVQSLRIAIRDAASKRPRFGWRRILVLVKREGIDFSRPGKPTDNAHIESFNGRVRQELLNPSWFDTIEQARREAGAWRRDYNEIRPHRSLGNKSPKEFVLARERDLASA
jgi:putative transposase